jgi:pimeloyl-ACP methyl ester carboxylesterase
MNDGKLVQRTKSIGSGQTSVAKTERYNTGSITSKDRTAIGYYQLGHGPGLVILHGAAESAQSHTELAEALSEYFTVYLPDRRGRGLSGPYGKEYSIQDDIDDLDALLTITGVHYVFGVSSGAIICLQAALTLPDIHKVAVYEPPLFPNRSDPEAILTRFDREMAEGEIVSAMITAMKGSRMGPRIFNLMPRWLLEPIMIVTMKLARSGKREQKKAMDDVTMEELFPTLHYDFQLVVDVAGKVENFKDVRVEVLLLGGSKSPAYLKAGLEALQKIVPRSTRVQFPGLGHGGSGNADLGGKPDLLANELRRFFAQPL